MPGKAKGIEKERGIRTGEATALADLSIEVCYFSSCLGAETRFKLMANIRQAEVRDEIGTVCLELEGERSSLKKAFQWLKRKGVKVEPVEISVITE